MFTVEMLAPRFCVSVTPLLDLLAVFVHQSDIVSNGFRFLVEGEAVEFDVIESERGLVAQKVTAPGGGPVHENRQDNGSEQVRY